MKVFCSSSGLLIWVTGIGPSFAQVSNLNLKPIRSANQGILRIKAKSFSKVVVLVLTGSVNAYFLSLLCIFLPGSIKVDNAKEKIPSWLYSNYSEVFRTKHLIVRILFSYKLSFSLSYCSPFYI